MRNRTHSSPLRNLGIAGAFCLAIAVAAPGCQAATNTTAVQCTSESECLSLGPEFAGTTCDATTKTCVKVDAEVDRCKTNKECIDRNSGVASICRKSDRKCVQLTTPDCPVVLAQPTQLLDDSTIVVGAVVPSGVTFDGGLGTIMEKTMALAQAELSKQNGGVPAVDGTSKPRPLVILSCHEFAIDGYAGVERMANHLAKDVQVPLIIGPVDMAHATQLINRVSIPNNILMILPTGQITQLGSLPSAASPSPLSWSLLYNEEAIATMVSELVSKQLEPKLRAEGVVGPIRIAVMIEDNFLGQVTTDAVEKKLVFNGMSATANGTANPPNYLRLNDGDSQDLIGNPAPEGPISKSVGAVFGFKPHIILHAYPPSAIAPTFFPIAFGWPGATMGAPLPYHVDVVGTFPAFAPLSDIIGATGLKERVFTMATNTGPDHSKTDEWRIRFNAANPDLVSSPLPSAQIAQVWYDATYFAAYAIAANGNKPLTGVNLAQTLPKLVPPGQEINVGQADLAKAFQLLGGGQSINVQGLTGNLDLRLKDASTNYDMLQLCPGTDPMGKIAGWRPSGWFTAGGVGMGTINCK